MSGPSVVQPSSFFNRKPSLAASVTLDNWREVLRDCQCKACGLPSASWGTQESANNNAIGLVCPCGQNHPASGVMWLKQNTSKKRREPSPESTSETWERCGNRCYHCSLTVDQLRRFGIGLNQHHVYPYAEFGHSDLRYLIPLCAWCHDDASARQRYYARIVKATENDHA